MSSVHSHRVSISSLLEPYLRESWKWSDAEDEYTQLRRDRLAPERRGTDAWIGVLKVLGRLDDFPGTHHLVIFYKSDKTLTKLASRRVTQQKCPDNCAITLDCEIASSTDTLNYHHHHQHLHTYVYTRTHTYIHTKELNKR